MAWGVRLYAKEHLALTELLDSIELVKLTTNPRPANFFHGEEREDHIFRSDRLTVVPIGIVAELERKLAVIVRNPDALRKPSVIRLELIVRLLQQTVVNQYSIIDPSVRQNCPAFVENAVEAIPDSAVVGSD